jgi:hypothetical protein
MHRDWRFAVVFTVGIVLTLYFLGTSITGFMVQSMYCDQGECREFCIYETDCTKLDEMCCDINGYGVCTHVSDCSKNYEFSIESDVENLPTLETPAPVLKSNMALYGIIFGLLLMIGYIYFVSRKHSKKAHSKKR